MFYFLFFVYFGSLTFSFQPHLLINSSFKKEVKKNKSVIICGFLHCQAYFNMLFRVNIKYHIITTYPVHSHDIPTRNHQKWIENPLCPRLDMWRLEELFHHWHFRLALHQGLRLRWKIMKPPTGAILLPNRCKDPKSVAEKNSPGIGRLDYSVQNLGWIWKKNKHG